MLSATPVNLRNRDLFNLLELLVPGEFEDLASLEERIAPNRVLNQHHRVAARPRRRPTPDGAAGSRSCTHDLFGRALDAAARLQASRRTLSLRPTLDAGRCGAGQAALRRAARPVRRDHPDPQGRGPGGEAAAGAAAASRSHFDDDGGGVLRGVLPAGASSVPPSPGMPLNFAMQMPLRLAGSCLPEAAALRPGVGQHRVRLRGRTTDAESPAPAQPRATSHPAATWSTSGAQRLTSDTKFDQFLAAIDDLVRQDKQAIVFTFSRRTLRYLERDSRRDARVGVLHGGVAKRRERDEVMADFRGGELRRPARHQGRQRRPRLRVLLGGRQLRPAVEPDGGRAAHRPHRPHRPDARRSSRSSTSTRPGTIESDIIERVMDRIGVFEHAIGELEPILDSRWKQIEKLLFDFTLSEPSATRSSAKAILAVEEQAKRLQDVEAAAPSLIQPTAPTSRARARPPGQRTLRRSARARAAARRLGRDIRRHGERKAAVLSLRGNDEMADHLQTLVRTGERVTAKSPSTYTVDAAQRAAHRRVFARSGDVANGAARPADGDPRTDPCGDPNPGLPAGPATQSFE